MELTARDSPLQTLFFTVGGMRCWAHCRCSWSPFKIYNVEIVCCTFEKCLISPLWFCPTQLSEGSYLCSCFSQHKHPSGEAVGGLNPAFACRLFICLGRIRLKHLFSCYFFVAKMQSFRTPKYHHGFL